MKIITSILLLWTVLGWTATGLAAQISNVRTSTSPSKVRVVLDSKGILDYKEHYQNNMLILEFPEGKAKAVKPDLKDKLVQSVELKPLGKGSNLVVKLGKSCKYKIFRLKNPDRLVIDFPKIVVLRENKQLARGVNYTFIQDDFQGRQIRAYAVALDQDANYEWRPFSVAGNYNGRGSLAARTNKLGLKAAVNASYFDTDGWVVGTTKDRGRFLSMERDPHSAYMVNKGQASIVKDVAYKGVARLSDGKLLEVKGMNRQRIADDLVVYNEFFAPSTKTNNWGREVKVNLRNNTIMSVSTLGNMSIEPGTIVISGHGYAAKELAKCRIGDQLVFKETLAPSEAEQAETVLGAGPMLLEKGQINVRIKEEGIAQDIAYGRAPRTAIGVKKDGGTIVLVVDGRSEDSAGMTLKELASYMLKLGAWDAINLDGGGSSEICLDGKIVNHPSDGRERAISMGLGLFPKR